MAPSLEDRIQQLKAFEAENGHLIVTVACKNDGLGSWVNNTRAKKAKGKLKPEMVDELDKLGFVWAIPKGPAKEELIEWGKQYRWLVNFHKNKGHCNVPAKIAGKDCACATWCDEQRRLYNDGQLDQGREKKLEILGFDFYGSSEDEPVSSTSPPPSYTRPEISICAYLS